MRGAYVFVVLAIVLSSLLGVRLWMQHAALNGPAGGAGVVEGTDTVIASRISARVLTVEVKEGQEVEAGAVLATLDCSEPQATLAEAQARMAMAIAQADAASHTAKATLRSGAAQKQSSKAAAAQAASLVVQRDQAERTATRLDSLGEDVATDRRESARTQAAGLDQQATGALANRAATAAQAAAAADQGRAAEANATAATDAVQAAQATVAKADLLVKECTVIAPSPGFVETLPWHVGELVQSGAVLARLVDIREVKASFYVPNAEVGGVKAGATAEVVADAYPDETFTGHVSTVSLTAEFTPRNIQTRSDRDRLVYPVEVLIPNGDGKLRPGMPVQVTIIGGR